MRKLKNPSRVWKPGNLIPTVTQGRTIHAAIVNRKTIFSICHDIAANRFRFDSEPWRDFRAKLSTVNDPMGWVNCKKCLRAADGWMGLVQHAPPGPCPQPSHPTDLFFREMSHNIIKADEDQKRILWLILADHFDDQGDPRGEFIRIIQEIGQKPDEDEHPLRRVQLINHAWRLDEQIWPSLPGLGRSQTNFASLHKQ